MRDGIFGGGAGFAIAAGCVDGLSDGEGGGGFGEGESSRDDVEGVRVLRLEGVGLEGVEGVDPDGEDGEAAGVRVGLWLGVAKVGEGLRDVSLTISLYHSSSWMDS